MKAEQYSRDERELAGWRVTVETYALGDARLDLTALDHAEQLFKVGDEPVGVLFAYRRDRVKARRSAPGGRIPPP